MKTTVSTGNRVFFYLYRWLLIPWVVTLLPFAALFNRKLGQGLRLRRQRSEPLPFGAADPIWIHASSGEFEYAKPLIRRLKETHPAIPIVVTFFSPTYSNSVRQFPGVDRALPLPLDLPGPCRAFLTKFHPRALLISRTDLWPEVLEQCRLKNVPVTIFSYTQKPMRSRWKRLFTRSMLQWVQRIECVSAADRDNLQTIEVAANVHVMGDSRYDQVAYRLSHPKALNENLRPASAPPVMVAGSTWPEDETVLISAFGGLLRDGKMKLILVPHEPSKDHLENLARALNKADLSFAYFSNGSAWPQDPVLLVDQVGVLAELYAWGELAFVGGSFRKSVHSVMEPLGAGAQTFVGPFFENNREAAEFSALPIGDGHGVTVCRSAEEMTGQVRKVLEQTPAQRKNFRLALKREFDSRLGATDRLVEILKDLLI